MTFVTCSGGRVTLGATQSQIWQIVNHQSPSSFASASDHDQMFSLMEFYTVYQRFEQFIHTEQGLELFFWIIPSQQHLESAFSCRDSTLYGFNAECGMRTGALFTVLRPVQFADICWKVVKVVFLKDFIMFIVSCS